MNFDVGSQVGDYQIVGTLGAGGMGKVYKVRSLISERIEAMKIVLPDLATEPELADRFLREIKVQASLEHPNIAALHTAIRVENQLLMLMEFVEGTTLEQKLKAGPLPVDEAVDYMRQVLSALEYAHAHGVIHRDLKPPNMILTPSGEVKLMDFGIAKAASDRPLTMTGATLGSLYYMSPEQIQGSAGLDARSDLYSLGVTLYELVTGKRPFDGDSQYAIMAAHLEKTPIPPITVDPRLPQLLNDVILMSVMKDPAARFQTAGAFRNALGSVVAPAPTVTAAAMGAGSPAGEPAKPRSRRGLWMAMGAVACALAVVGVIEFGPRKGTKAAQGSVSEPTASAPAPRNDPAPSAPATTAPPTSEPQPAATAPAAAQQQPAVNPPAPSLPTTVAKQGSPGPSAPVPQRAPTQQPTSSQQQASSQPAVRQAPQPQAPQPQASQPQASQPQVPQPAAVVQPQRNDAAVRAALAEVREQLVMLTPRATGIRGTLQRMEAAQAAQGHSLNASLQEPLQLMNSFLDEAANALNSGDAAAAKSYKEKAERQIERLEKLLNR